MLDPYRARCVAWLRALCFGEPRPALPSLPGRMASSFCSSFCSRASVSMSISFVPSLGKTINK